MILEVIIILFLILLNGLLSASEIAIVSSRKTKLQVAADKNISSARHALLLKNSPNNFLSTVQIGITLIGILTGYFSGGTISVHLAKVLDDVPLLSPYSSQIAFIFVVLSITYLSLVIGELVPKRIGMAIPEKYSMLIAFPMSLLSKAVKPFVWLLSTSTDAIVRMLNIKVSDNSVTEEEIKALVDEGVSSGVIEDYEHDLWDRILVLGDKRAVNLMVHRSNVAHLDVELSEDEVKAFVMENEHTEYPVCLNNFDNIIGLIHMKTLFKKFINNEKVDIKSLCKDVPFVNENALIYQVLKIIKDSKVQTAVVVDEYGTPQGIITVKDILDNLIGSSTPLNDEDRTLRITKREDGSSLVDGRFQLVDFLTHFNVVLDDEESIDLKNTSTIGGLVFSLLDRMPKEGDILRYKSLKIEILDMDGNRIDKIAVYKTDDKIKL